MHDELMSSMDISQKMLKLTACAMLPMDDKRLNEVQSSAADTDSNDSAINDMNVCTDSLTQNPDTNHFKAKSQDSIHPLVSELSNDETNHICQHFSREETAVEADDEQQSVAIESAKVVDEESSDCEDRAADDSDSRAPVDSESAVAAGSAPSSQPNSEPMDTALEVVDGCVYPPYDPPADKKLRYTNQLQFLRTMMTKYLCRYKTALPFLKPVNCDQLKIPDYYKVITDPMDMLTIKRRMLCLWYTSADECLRDFRLMFSNCYRFNCCDNYVYKAGKKLEEYLDEKLKEMPQDEVEIACPAKQSAAEMEKRAAKRKPDVSTQELHDLSVAGRSMGAPPADVAALLAHAAKKPTTRSEHGIHMKKPTKELPESAAAAPQLKRVPLNTSMKFCLEIIRELMSKKHRDYAWPFYEPVSTQVYPDYLDVVKKPIDLTTIKTKIETGQYKTVKPFVKDMRRMITNCLRYNKPEAPVIEQARRLRDFFEYKWARIPEELLKERLTTSQAHQQNGADVKKEAVGEESAVESSRMKLLETQVRLLTSTLTALTGIDAKQLTAKPKNGQRKVAAKRSAKANRVSGGAARRPSAAKLADDSDSEDESESDEELVVSPSPISFDPNDMEDLQQLKTDLENLNAKDLKNVLRILRQTEPSIKCDNDENIEIDFEALKPETLVNLRKFVSSCMLTSSAKMARKGSAAANCDIKNGHSTAAGQSSPAAAAALRLSDSSSDESDSSSDSESD